MAGADVPGTWPPGLAGGLLVMTVPSGVGHAFFSFLI
jgi:hypothetical protein